MIKTHLKHFFLLIILLLSNSCEINLKNDIAENLDRQLINNNQIISLKDYIDFDWDKMIVSNTSADLDEINKALGFDYPYFEDIASRLILIKNKKVVYHQERFPDPENKSIERLLFLSNDEKLNIMVFDKKNSIFRVHKKKYNNILCYELEQLKN